MKLKEIFRSLTEDIPTFTTWDNYGFLDVRVSDWKVDPYNYYDNAKKNELLNNGIKIIFDKYGGSEIARKMSRDLSTAIENGEVNDVYEIKQFVKEYKVNEINRSNSRHYN